MQLSHVLQMFPLSFPAFGFVYFTVNCICQDECFFITWNILVDVLYLHHGWVYIMLAALYRDGTIGGNGGN